jgi:hypothetical protein
VSAAICIADKRGVNGECGSECKEPRPDERQKRSPTSPGGCHDLRHIPEAARSAGLSGCLREHWRSPSSRCLNCDYLAVASSPEVAERLTVAWNASWPDTPPIAFLLRDAHPDRWVRFHSLPGSERYAETDAERATILARHHAVLEALGASGRCVVIWARFSSDRGSNPSVPGEVFWQSVENADYFEEPAQLYVSSIPYPSPDFDDVLRAAADWELAHAVVGPEDLGWLYHPYDGGADVIARSPEERDRLRAQFRDWLSPDPLGL